MKSSGVCGEFYYSPWLELKMCGRVLRQVAGWGWTKQALVSL